MTPLPSKPTVVILIDANGVPIKVASNIAPTPEFEVVVTRFGKVFLEESEGKPFNQEVPRGCSCHSCK